MRTHTTEGRAISDIEKAIEKIRHDVGVIDTLTNFHEKDEVKKEQVMMKRIEINKTAGILRRQIRELDAILFNK